MTLTSTQRCWKGFTSTKFNSFDCAEVFQRASAGESIDKAVSNRKMQERTAVSIVRSTYLLLNRQNLYGLKTAFLAPAGRSFPDQCPRLKIIWSAQASFFLRAWTFAPLTAQTYLYITPYISVYQLYLSFSH